MSKKPKRRLKKEVKIVLDTEKITKEGLYNIDTLNVSCPNQMLAATLFCGV